MIGMSRSLRFRSSTVAVLTGLLTVPAAFAGPHPASAGSAIKVTYPVKGSTFIKAANFNLALGPGTLASKVNLTTGAITANLKLPDATGSFKQNGLIPVTATTQFINDGPTTGTLNINTGAVKSTSRITLKVVQLIVSGVDVPVGNSCETSTPVTVSVASQPGFNVVKGGNLAGTYTISQFANCELATALINLTIPGPGNTITLKLGAARPG